MSLATLAQMVAGGAGVTILRLNSLCPPRRNECVSVSARSQ